MEPVETIAVGAAILAMALAGCNGLTSDDGSAPLDGMAATPLPSATAVYGAEYQGDAGACATVICSGAQVCCVLPVPSDAATPHPNNKCDYDCIALCMDSCPAVSAAGIDAAPSLAPGTHGGGIGAAPASADADTE